MSLYGAMFFFVVLETPIPVAAAADVEDVSPAQLLQGAVDPYNPGQQRAAFLRAAGKDMLLSETEFNKESERRTGFVRIYDTWANLRLFDLDENGELDWFEAREYRKAFRDVVMAKYDQNRNRRLDDGERIEAARNLTHGKIPKLHPPDLPETRRAGSADLANQPDISTSAFTQLQRKVVDTMLSPNPPPMNYYEDRLKAFDLDGDGMLSDEEYQAIYEASRARVIELWDRNGDGKLDAGEWGLYKFDRREQKLAYLEETMKTAVAVSEFAHDQQPEKYSSGAEKKRWLEMQRDQLRGRLRLIREKYDIDEDGVLNTYEAAAWNRDNRVDQNRYQEMDFSTFDKNQDGILDGEEADQKLKRMKMREDLNGDGRVSATEEIALMERMLQEFDINRDGILSEKEEYEAKIQWLKRIAAED